MNLEIAKIPRGAAMLLLSAALLALTACSSTPSPSKSNSNQPTNPATYADQGNFEGQVVVNTVIQTNTVVSIDAAQRRIELKHADGKITSYKCGPQVANFDQIKVGDQVKATVVDEVALFIKPASQMQSITATAVAVGARLGAKPGVVSLDTLNFTAKVLSINPWLHQVTLQTADGQTKPVQVGEFVNLADFNVGDQVVVRLTQALAVLVEKP
ncbi:MAG: hypothetical protein WAO02_04255 [Verrucomicrobiia bacterium]